MELDLNFAFILRSKKILIIAYHLLQKITRLGTANLRICMRQYGTAK